MTSASAAAEGAPATELAASIRRVAGGERLLDPQLALDTLTGADPLTERERQALSRAAQGLSSAQIARAPHLSEGTVRGWLQSPAQSWSSAYAVRA